MKVIKLTQGYEAIIDDADYVYLSQFKWSYHKGYAQRCDHSTGKLKTIYMHREIMRPPLEMVVDHISGDKLNNQRSNLRICTHAQNQRNYKKPVTNTSGYKGIYFDKSANKWRANISVNNKTIHLGYFSTPELAYEAYKVASKKYHKEFGRTE